MEANNMFKDSKFGYKYKTKGGRIARFVCATKFTNDKMYCLYIEGEEIPYWYKSNGTCTLLKEYADIVSRLENDKFDYSGDMVEKAKQYADNNFGDGYTEITTYDIEEAYLAGYRDGNEE